MSNILLENIQPLSVIYTGFAACLAMGMSGSFGRYFSEQAERKRALHQMESYMFTDLSGSIIERESEKKVLLISLIDGLSPALAAAIPIIPFFLAYQMIISIQTSIIIAFTLDFLILFILGAFLGKLSGENIIKHGFLIVAVGFLTGLIIFLSSILLQT
jgi:predicted membrane protein (TIGR00267 family)